MAKRTVAMSLCVLLVCLCMLPVSAASSTTEAKEPIRIEEACQLAISYGYETTMFAGQTIKLYQVAEVSSDFQYTLTPDFAESALSVNGIQTQGEWNTIRTTLESYIMANSIEADYEAVTEEDGQVIFSQLAPGLYLASEVTIAREELTCHFDAALVALPGLDFQGYWQSQVDVAAKPEVLPPVGPDEEAWCKVVKLWQGNDTDRPKSVEVEIFRNGISYQKVTLSEENQWSYRWSVKNDGASWQVAEQNVPVGYTVTVQAKGDTFVVTNTWSDPNDPQTPPQTGDSFPVMLFVVLFYLSGSLLLILGIAGKRKAYENKN